MKFYSHLFPLSEARGAAVGDLFQQHSVAKPAVCSRQGTVLELVVSADKMYLLISGNCHGVSN